MRCPKCGSEETGNFCGRCGTKLSASGPKCGKCGAGLEKGAAFCAECGTPTGERSSKPAAAYLPWVFSALALVAFAIAIAFFVRGQAAPRVGDMTMTGGLPEAPQGSAMGGGAPADGMVDLSRMTPRQAADRLFERAMMTEDEGDNERAKFFAEMAVQAYAAVPEPEMDLDAHFHLGLIHLLREDIGAAESEAEQILSVRPTHLLGLALQARVAESNGDTNGMRETYGEFLSNLEAERLTGLSEYEMHGSYITSEAARAQELTGGS